MNQNSQQAMSRKKVKAPGKLAIGPRFPNPLPKVKVKKGKNNAGRR
jgi:hypothetical protein